MWISGAKQNSLVFYYFQNSNQVAFLVFDIDAVSLQLQHKPQQQPKITLRGHWEGATGEGGGGKGVWGCSPNAALCRSVNTIQLTRRLLSSGCPLLSGPGKDAKITENWKRQADDDAKEGERGRWKGNWVCRWWRGWCRLEREKSGLASRMTLMPHATCRMANIGTSPILSLSLSVAMQHKGWWHATSCNKCFREPLATHLHY